MDGVSDWTRARQQQRLGEASEESSARPASDAGSVSADPLRTSQQALSVCSLLQVRARERVRRRMFVCSRACSRSHR